VLLLFHSCHFQVFWITTTLSPQKDSLPPWTPDRRENSLLPFHKYYSQSHSPDLGPPSAAAKPHRISDRPNHTRGTPPPSLALFSARISPSANATTTCLYFLPHNLLPSCPPPLFPGPHTHPSATTPLPPLRNIRFPLTFVCAAPPTLCTTFRYRRPCLSDLRPKPGSAIYPFSPSFSCLAPAYPARPAPLLSYRWAGRTNSALSIPLPFVNPNHPPPPNCSGTPFFLSIIHFRRWYTVDLPDPPQPPPPIPNATSHFSCQTHHERPPPISLPTTPSVPVDHLHPDPCFRATLTVSPSPARMFTTVALTHVL